MKILDKLPLGTLISRNRQLYVLCVNLDGKVLQNVRVAGGIFLMNLTGKHTR